MVGINILILGIVSFLNDVSSEMMLTILPLFIVSCGGTAIAVGLIGGIGDAIASILKVFSGYLSDKMKRRKPLVFSGYLTSSLTKLFLPLSSSWLHIFGLRTIERIGKGIRTAPRDAIIAESSSKEKRSTAFGIHRALDTGGAVFGSLIAFLLFYYLKFGFRPILFISAVIGFTALIPFIFVKEKHQEGISSGMKLVIKGLSLKFKSYLFIAFLFSLSNFSYMFFILRAKGVFGEVLDSRLASAIPLLLYVIFNVVYAIFSIPVGIISDRLSRRKTLALGYFIYSMTCVGFIFAKSISMFVALFCIYGLSYAFIEGNQRAYASLLAGKETTGTALGTFHTVTGIALIPAGLIAGMLWNINPAFSFTYGMGFSLIASLLLLSSSD